jgi:hypothetical protein
MRTFAIAAVLASLALLSPGIASAKVMGTVTLGYEYDSYDTSGDNYYSEDHEQGTFISGAVIGPVMNDSSDWFIEGAGRIQSEAEKYNHVSETFNDNVGHGAIYLGRRDSDWGLAGYYAIQNDHGSDVQEVGAEVQKYFSNMTLDASATYGKHNGSYCCDDYSAWDVQADLTYYFNDDWSASAGVGYSAFDYHSGNTDITTVGVSGEYRIPSTNFSVRGSYTYGDASDTYADYKSNTFQVAFIVDLGATSAKDRDQHGASFHGADSFDQDWRLWEASYD